MAGWNVSREVAVIPIAKALNARYVTLAIGNMQSQRWLGGVAKGVAYTGVNIEDLRRLPLPIPPIEEQAEIVETADRLLELADGILARVDVVGKRVGRSSPTILAKAFGGEFSFETTGLDRRSSVAAQAATEFSH